MEHAHSAVATHVKQGNKSSKRCLGLRCIVLAYILDKASGVFSVSSFILLYKIYDICSSSSFPTGAPGGVGNGFGGHGGGGFHSHHHPHHYVDPFKLFESVFAGKDPFDFHRQFHHSASVDPFASFFQVSPADITGILMPCTVVKLGIPKFWGISLPHFLCTQFNESLIEPHSKQSPKFQKKKRIAGQNA